MNTFSNYQSNSGVRGVELCPPLELPENAQTLVYEGSDHPKIEAVAEAFCLPGYFPDLSNGQKLKTKCKAIKNSKGQYEYQWIRSLPKCVTCKGGLDPHEAIQSGPDDIDVFCTFQSKLLQFECEQDSTFFFLSAQQRATLRNAMHG